MAKRKKSRRTPPPNLNNTASEHAPIVPTNSSAPIAQPEVRSRTRKTITKFGEWALKKAFDYLLLGVLAIVTAPSVAIYLYFRSGRAAWMYPWLYAAFGFIAACVVIIIMASLLSLIRARRKRAAERTINLEFQSEDKGYLDHAVNQAKSFKALNSLVNQLGEIMLKIAKTNQRATAFINFAKKTLTPYPNVLALVGQRIAARTARKLNVHATEMQTVVTKLHSTSDLLIESFTGYTSWYPVNTPEEAQVLMSNKAALERMLTVMRGSIGSTEFFRDSLRGLYGISQRLNTAANRMIRVTEGVVSFLEQNSKNWEQAIELIDQKLSNLSEQNS